MRTRTISLVILVLGVVAEGLAAPIQLVQDQASEFVIYHDRAAPPSVATAAFDCTSLSVDRKQITVAAGSAGWWKLRIKRAPTGAMDDVWVKAGDELSGYFSPAPNQALDVPGSHSFSSSTSCSCKAEPLLDSMSGTSMSKGRPLMPETRPPASSTISAPAAMSHGLRLLEK